MIKSNRFKRMMIKKSSQRDNKVKSSFKDDGKKLSQRDNDKKIILKR